MMPSKFLPGALVAGTLLVGCDREPSAEMLDEAYRVGYDVGLADECGRHGVRIEPMPSAYDDSLDEGHLTAAFQAGYYSARGEEHPCK